MKIPEKFPVVVKRGSVQVRIRREINGTYKRFTVEYNDGGRKRKKFSDYTEAKREAEYIATRLASGDLTALSLTGKDRKIYATAVKALEPTDVPLDVAAQRYARAHKSLEGVSLDDAIAYYVHRCPSGRQSRTVQEVFTELIEAKEKDGCSEVYLKDLRFRVGKFCRAFHCQISNITAGDLNEYLRSLSCLPGGRNNHRGVLATLFKFAEARDYLPKNHADFSRVDKARETHSAIDIFTVQEMTALLNAAVNFRDDERRGMNRRYTDRVGVVMYLALGGFAGLRTAEIQRQLWTDILLDRGFIRVTAAKGNTAQKRLVPIQDNLKEWLTMYWRQDGLCCEYKNMTNAAHRIAKRAGVAWKHNALRHSFISNRVAQIQNIPQTSHEAGNSVAVVNRNYRELVTPEEAASWFEIRPKQDSKILPMSLDVEQVKSGPKVVPKTASLL